jgi:hypothetical protein
MTPAARKLVAGFEAAAQAAQEAEAQLRKYVAQEIARIEAERQLSFRRARVIHLLASSSFGSEDEAAALSAQAVAVREELGLKTENAAHEEIVAHLRPVGQAVWACACSPEEHVDPAAARAALGEFESWFETSRGRPFYSLFDRYMPDTPVVDF